MIGLIFFLFLLYILCSEHFIDFDSIPDFTLFSYILRDYPKQCESAMNQQIKVRPI